MNKELSQRLQQAKHIHFIGIGGISMSALALILKNKGYTVSGSDMKESDMTRKLQSKGITVYIGHDAKNVEGAEVVINTAAVKADNVEMVAAKEAGIPIYERAVLLGTVMSKYDYPIAIAGTHGKTTSTSMTSQILLQAGKDPSCLVGGQLSTIGGNIRIGESQYLVCEACEYVDSFLNFAPKIGVVLNVDADHLDYFKDIDHIKRSFHTFCNLCGEDGTVIANADDPNTMDVVKDILPKVITYGIDHTDCPVTARNLKKSDHALFAYDLYFDGQLQGTVHLHVPGRHNVLNSLAAAACARILGVDSADIISGLQEYRGTKRRFERLGSYHGAAIVDDYAHHPTEIKATLSAAKDLQYDRVICVFQPHTYTRVINLLDEFAQALTLADQVVLADVYAAREKNTTGFSCQTLADKIPGAIYLDSFDKIKAYLAETCKDGDLVLTMGAGDINKIGYDLVKE